MGAAEFRCGYAALVGRPNVGKSTLLNRLVGKKLSIVTHKVQTTRHRILGILSDDGLQVVFLDTPGVIQPRSGLQQSMMRQVQGALSTADLVLLMVDARDTEPDEHMLQRTQGLPTLLLLNKVDRIQERKVLPLADAYLGLRDFEAVLPLSALTGYNEEALVAELRQRLPVGPPLYPPDMISEHPERFFVSEIIREKVLQQFRQEVPYAVAVNISQYDEVPGRKDLIHADIVVERASQKGILIGAGGRALKAVGVAARKDIEAFLGRPVYLKLFVQVRANWRNQSTLLRSYGY